MSGKKKGLGRGLSALFGDAKSVDKPQEINQLNTVSISDLSRNPYQPRQYFSEEKLNELANSIKKNGIIQPIAVRPNKSEKGKYEIVAGERRWRAAQLAQLDALPVIVKDFSDNEVLEIAIIENIQREELNPIEEARGYQQLMEKFGRTQEQVSTALGKSRSYVANLLRLLNLPDEVIGYLVSGQISAGHAKVLVSSDEAIKISRLIISDNLSVRETEKLVRSLNQSDNKTLSQKPKKTILKQKDTDTKAIEKELSAALGLRVFIEHSAGGENGSIILKYQTLEEFDQVRDLLIGE